MTSCVFRACRSGIAAHIERARADGIFNASPPFPTPLRAFLQIGEDGYTPHPYAGLDKAAVIQECRCFHDANFVKMHPKRCCQQIVRYAQRAGRRAAIAV